MEYIVGIDAGTTYLKSALIGIDGKVYAIEKQQTPLCSSGEEKWYHPDQIFEMIRDQIVRLSALPILNGAEHILGICIAGMAEAGLILERSTGQELTEILPWFDKRTEVLSSRLNQEEIHERFIKTGLFNSYKYGIYKYRWLLDAFNLSPSGTIWMSMCDYLAFRLTGEYSTVPGFAVRTYAYDMVHGCWDETFLEKYGLNIDNFPCVSNVGHTIGNCKDKTLCKALGNHKKVTISGHDHICSLFAIAGGHAGRMVDSCGTAETYMGVVEKCELERLDYDRGIVYGPYPEKGKWFWMGNLPSSGQSVEWYRQDLYQTPISYDKMESLLQSIKDPTGIFYFPFMSGVGTPVYRGDIEPQFIGKKDFHSENDILKSVIEGIQYQGKWILNCAPLEANLDCLQLWCTGGAVNSREWMEIKADILGIPVHITVQEEATLLGAAAIFLREHETEAVVNAFCRTVREELRVYKPDQTRVERYHELAEEYRKLAEGICWPEDRKNLLLGCIADDFTGASDAASFLRESEFRPVLFNGIPDTDQLIPEYADTAVIALKTRTMDKEKAVELTLSAARWLKRQGTKQFYLKYCSTFDSTDQGNIGPAADALMDFCGAACTVLCPALPVNRRQVKDGHIYVEGKPLNESSMRNHPLTPMKDSFIPALMAGQSLYPCYVLSGPEFRDKDKVKELIAEWASGNKHFYVIPDYETEEDGKRIGEMFEDLQLLTGGSGLLSHLAYHSRKLKPYDRVRGVQGKTVLLSGSCSQITLEQISKYRVSGKKIIEISPLELLHGRRHAEDYIQLLEESEESELLFYSSASPSEVKEVQRFGTKKVAGMLETIMTLLAERALELGYHKIIVAGGETSGAVTKGLGFSTFEIGPVISPGVPVLRPLDRPDVRLVLKSGNFGGPDFFLKAIQICSRTNIKLPDWEVS